MNQPDNVDPDFPRNITNLALVFETALAVVALGIGWAISHKPYHQTYALAGEPVSNSWALLWGVLATGPMLIAFYAINRFPLGPLGRLKRVVEQLIVPLFARTTVIQIVLISLAAGIGEELLFRGLLQAALTEQFEGQYRWIWPLIIASVVFGVCHWITTTYAILAALIGAYLGLLYLYTGNIIAPIFAHALYDFVALVVLVKVKTVPHRGE